MGSSPLALVPCAGCCEGRVGCIVRPDASSAGRSLSSSLSWAMWLALPIFLFFGMAKIYP